MSHLRKGDAALCQQGSAWWPPTWQHTRKYEALACLHEDRTYAALMARHNVRMENIARPPDRLLLEAMGALAPVPVLDAVLRKYVTDRGRLPAAYGGKWIDHLAWGVDSVVAALRLLMSGQFVGAALIAPTSWSAGRTTGPT